MNEPRMQALQNAVMAMAFHPDGNRLALGQQSALTLWDVASGKLIREYTGGASERASPDDAGEALLDNLNNDGALSLSFSPDGRQLVAIAPLGEFVWDVETARTVPNARPARTGGEDDGLTDRLLSRGVAVSPDGHFVARGYGKTLQVWDLQSGRAVASLAGHLSDVNSVSYAAGGKLLVSGARDGALRLWSMPERQTDRAAQLIALGASDYVAVTPIQYYRASKRRISGVSFRVGEQIYPFEQFDLRFNRPDVVLARLGRTSPEVVQGYRTAYERRLRRMGISESALTGDVRLPEVRIVDTTIP